MKRRAAGAAHSRGHARAHQERVLSATAARAASEHAGACPLGARARSERRAVQQRDALPMRLPTPHLRDCSTRGRSWPRCAPCLILSDTFRAVGPGTGYGEFSSNSARLTASQDGDGVRIEDVV